MIDEDPDDDALEYIGPPNPNRPVVAVGSEGEPLRYPCRFYF